MSNSLTQILIQGIIELNIKKFASILDDNGVFEELPKEIYLQKMLARFKRVKRRKEIFTLDSDLCEDCYLGRKVYVFSTSRIRSRLTIRYIVFDDGNKITQLHLCALNPEGKKPSD